MSTLPLTQHVYKKMEKQYIHPATSLLEKVSFSRKSDRWHVLSCALPGADSPLENHVRSSQAKADVYEDAYNSHESEDIAIDKQAASVATAKTSQFKSMLARGGNSSSAAAEALRQSLGRNMRMFGGSSPSKPAKPTAHEERRDRRERRKGTRRPPVQHSESLDSSDDGDDASVAKGRGRSEGSELLSTLSKNSERQRTRRLPRRRKATGGDRSTGLSDSEFSGEGGAISAGENDLSSGSTTSEDGGNSEKPLSNSSKGERYFASATALAEIVKSESTNCAVTFVYKGRYDACCFGK